MLYTKLLHKIPQLGFYLKIKRYIQMFKSVMQCIEQLLKLCYS